MGTFDPSLTDESVDDFQIRLVGGLVGEDDETATVTLLYKENGDVHFTNNVPQELQIDWYLFFPDRPVFPQDENRRGGTSQTIDVANLGDAGVGTLRVTVSNGCTTKAVQSMPVCSKCGSSVKGIFNL